VSSPPSPVRKKDSKVGKRTWRKLHFSFLWCSWIWDYQSKIRFVCTKVTLIHFISRTSFSPKSFEAGLLQSCEMPIDFEDATFINQQDELTVSLSIIIKGKGTTGAGKWNAYNYLNDSPGAVLTTDHDIRKQITTCLVYKDEDNYKLKVTQQSIIMVFLKEILYSLFFLVQHPTIYSLWYFWIRKFSNRLLLCYLTLWTHQQWMHRISSERFGMSWT